MAYTSWNTKKKVADYFLPPVHSQLSNSVIAQYYRLQLNKTAK